MREKRMLSLLISVINVIGVICLICFAIPYLTNETTIAYSNAMLPAQAWDRAGMALTFGFVPLLLANVFCFLFIKVKRNFVRFLFFVPSALCFLIMISYWATSLA